MAYLVKCIKCKNIILSYFLLLILSCSIFLLRKINWIRGFVACVSVKFYFWHVWNCDLSKPGTSAFIVFLTDSSHLRCACVCVRVRPWWGSERFSRTSRFLKMLTCYQITPAQMSGRMWLFITFLHFVSDIYTRVRWNDLTINFAKVSTSSTLVPCCWIFHVEDLMVRDSNVVKYFPHLLVAGFGAKFKINMKVIHLLLIRIKFDRLSF